MILGIPIDYLMWGLIGFLAIAGIILSVLQYRLWKRYSELGEEELRDKCRMRVIEEAIERLEDNDNDHFFKIKGLWSKADDWSTRLREIEKALYDVTENE